MKITIDTESRVFLINRKGFFSRSYFCNLEHIPEIIEKVLEKNDEYTISEYWNLKFVRVNKKRLNEMFVAHKINFKL